MPDRRSIFRLLALAGFLLTVALALWLAELRPLPSSSSWLALLVAWTVEWLSWRQDLARRAEASTIGTAGRRPPCPGADPPPPGGSEPPRACRAPRPRMEFRRASSRVASPRRAGPEPEPPEARAEPGLASDRRPRRPVPRPPPVPRRPPSAPRPPLSDVIDLRTRVTAQPRRWNLWDLERRAREEAQRDPLRYEEWSYLFVHLRQFATPDGSLPIEFDGLVRESFGELLEHAG